MNPETFLRLTVPAILAVFVAFGMDRMLLARGLFPPGFREPWRRGLAGGLIALILWVGTFSSLGSIGQVVEQPDLKNVSTPQLFLLHVLLLMTIGAWFLLGYAGVRRPSPPQPPSPEPGEGGEEIVVTAAAEAIPEPVPAKPPISLSPDTGERAGERGNGINPAPPPLPLWRQFLAQFGLLAPSVPREIGIGLLLGVGAWGAVLIAAIVIAGIVVALGGEKSLPQQPPALIPFLAGLPVALRLMISLSAGVVEELFFRGFLQPRIGIALSTLLFVFAHFSYGQPFMLIGITTLSLIYALMVRWRQTIWPAIAAHALFDGVQLLVIIPMVLEFTGKEAPKAVALLIGNWFGPGPV